MLKGGEVSRFVLGGADLMFPGVYIPPEGLPSFAAGEPWAVIVPGNVAPIAVGVTTVSSAEAMKAGFRGKALRITHYYRDTLWELAESQYVPNEGFYEDMVGADPEFVRQVSSELVSEDLGEAGSPCDDEELIHTANHPTEGTVEVETHNNERPPVASREGAELAGVIETLKTDDSVEEEKEVPEVPLTLEEMDMLLDKCLLQSLHTTVKEKDLPMSGSTLWSSHILPCRPPGTTLDLKKSSHKKLSKWLQSKSSTGLISAKEDKHRKEVMLLGFNRGHPDFMAFKPTKRALPQEAAAVPSGSDVQQSAVQLEVLELWKSSPHVSPIFEAVGADASRFYSTSEAVDIVFTYIEKENLVKPTDKPFVVLDATLCDALYKGTVKRGSSYPTEIHKRDLGATFLNRMQAHYRVCRGNESAIRKGTLKSVQIITERRQGNKKVTRVSGMEAFLVDADVLANELQKKFACSTSVGELPGKKGQYEVLVQGGVLEDLGRHLVHHYGIPKKYIEILDKTKK